MKQAIDRIFDKKYLSSVHLRIHKCCAKFIKFQYTSKEIGATSMVLQLVSMYYLSAHRYRPYLIGSMVNHRFAWILIIVYRLSEWHNGDMINCKGEQVEWTWSIVTRVSRVDEKKEWMRVPVKRVERKIASTLLPVADRKEKSKVNEQIELWYTVIAGEARSRMNVEQMQQPKFVTSMARWEFRYAMTRASPVWQSWIIAQKEQRVPM